jgi:DNA-binding transcriptional ArsR family regulator/uncharacterized protein YndB with AHSA1/START domain
MFAVAPSDSPVPDIWQALADPTRRMLIDRLSQGPLSTSALCEGVAMTRYGVMNHIGILERAGIITARRHGRMRFNHLNVAPLVALYDQWLTPRARNLGGAISAIATLSEGKTMNQNPDVATDIVEIALDWTISASIQKVWSTLTDHVETWWPVAHRAGQPAALMSMDASLGGALSEKSPDGSGVEWYRVIAVDARKSIDLAGHLASRYGGPAMSMLHLSLEPGTTEGTTILRLTDSVFGKTGPGLRASLTSGWQAIIGEGLIALVEQPH